MVLGLAWGIFEEVNLRTYVQGPELAEKIHYQAPPQVAMATNSYIPLRGGRVTEGTERVIGLVLQGSGLRVREDLAEIRAPMPKPQNLLYP